MAVIVIPQNPKWLIITFPSANVEVELCPAKVDFFVSKSQITLKTDRFNISRFISTQRFT